METEKFSNLKRERVTMPEFVATALREQGLTEAYKQRPAYQQNDYLLWITTAKKPQTQQKRLNQMLRELEQGGVYMNMPHKPSAQDS
ncbi:MAG: YdeI/OmpD-associated family protein [Deinococcota bacterium]